MSNCFIVAGPAASGKSEFARKLSAHLNYSWIDFDDYIDELVRENQELISKIGMEDFLRQVREIRYRDLMDRAKIALERGKDIVVSAPFTAEVQDENLWRARLEPVTRLGITPKLFWIETSPEVRRERMASRAEERDKEKVAKYVFQTISPKVERTIVDGEADFAVYIAETFAYRDKSE